MAHHKTLTCSHCGAHRGDRVVRKIDDPIKWALDTDLAEEFPDTWYGPERVVMRASGICKFCWEMR